MGLPNLSEPPPEDHPGYWDEYWFFNWIDHQDIQEEILRAKHQDLQLYPIIPWVPSDVSAILLRHQLMHNDMNSVIGALSQDLSNLNFKDPESVKEWVNNHYQEHLAAHTFLDI